MKSRFIRSTAGAAALLLLSCSAFASQTTTEEMTCQEFVNLNPRAMLPVAWWMLHEETIYKGGDTVSLNETDLTQVPQILDFCKAHPEQKVYSFKGIHADKTAKFPLLLN
ncbi:acid-activated periplasmic chaperone HdeB [Enterobacteriaceae bacterium 89]|nr:acid-activated periplasmic chaperone HdeB [Enterobacteriaceae bacterium 89]